MVANALTHRQNVLNERLKTERTYNESLHHFYKNFISKLEQEPFSSNAEVKKLFDSIKIIKIIMDISDRLLQEWDEEFKSSNKSDYLSDSDKAAGVTTESKLTQKLSAIYLKFLPFFKIYSSYANSFDEILVYVTKLTNENEEFKKLCTSFYEMPESNKLDVGSHIILPIQRLPRYGMLNNEVLKAT